MFTNLQAFVTPFRSLQLKDRPECDTNGLHDVVTVLDGMAVSLHGIPYTWPFLNRRHICTSSSSSRPRWDSSTENRFPERVVMGPIGWLFIDPASARKDWLRTGLRQARLVQTTTTTHTRESEMEQAKNRG
ncbi:hypothetical protein PCANC_06643 [Puccinia coronata f. sp. avenae]|uniref:Uncharacterized protein n=1 Tax=Puccinia coronata f. sp. avenae TaxID=200324 RepID=A0A2N5T062_9BASI|nr:hypothetical protein PCANC_06643 [Puccinia coronata f. sp. avenae]